LLLLLPSTPAAGLLLSWGKLSSLLFLLFLFPLPPPSPRPSAAPVLLPALLLLLLLLLPPPPPPPLLLLLLLRLLLLRLLPALGEPLPPSRWPTTNGFDMNCLPFQWANESRAI
jgi:hypothetical protein